MIKGIIVMALLIIIDQIAKVLTVSYISVGQSPIVIIPNILEFLHIKNDSAAWGMFGSVQWLFLPITIVALGVFGYLYYKSEYKKQRIYTSALVLLMAGTLGNAIDRLIYPGNNGFFSGYVIDTFRIPFFDYILGGYNFVFNIADLLLTLGIILFGIDLIFLEQKRKKKYENT